MTVRPAFARLILFVFLALFLNACSHIGESDVDEERESHFLAGKSKASSLDYKGAIESFEKALEVNPRSAAAHLELGLLYEEKVNDYAAAIYHFQRHLKLRPNSNVGEMVRGHINNCKLELAKSIPFQLINSKVQVGLDKLNSENLALRQQIEELKTRLAQASAAPNRAAQVSNTTLSHTNLPAPSATPERPIVHSDRSAARAERPVAAAERTPAPTKRGSETPRNREPSRATAAPTLHPHRVRPGDTIASIARQYKITEKDVLAANPGLSRRGLQSGETIHVPLIPK